MQKTYSLSESAQLTGCCLFSHLYTKQHWLHSRGRQSVATSMNDCCCNTEQAFYTCRSCTNAEKLDSPKSFILKWNRKKSPIKSKIPWTQIESPAVKSNLPDAIESRFKSNCDWDLPITAHTILAIQSMQCKWRLRMAAYVVWSLLSRDQRWSPQGHDDGHLVYVFVGKNLLQSSQLQWLFMRPNGSDMGTRCWKISSIWNATSTSCFIQPL